MKELFGKTKGGEEVFKYTIENGKYSLEVLTFGALIYSLKVPSKDKKIVDVVLGYNKFENYLNTDTFYGMSVGRVANRIKDAKFTLNGIEYNIEKNEGENSLHSGPSSLAFKNWACEETVINNNPALILSVTSFDGEGGFPANVTVKCFYILTSDGQLIVRYEGFSDKDTLLNMTNHSYFNLSGDPKTTILDHQLLLNCDKYVEIDDKLIPTGELLSVENTPFDFRLPHTIGERIEKTGNGYDHALCFADYTGQLTLVGTFKCDRTNIMMDIFTTLPSVQLYSGNFIGEKEINKDGSKGLKNSGICFETQFYPDSPNNENFPSIVLKKCEKYDHTTIYQFGTY
ncbi:MAG: aldose epimerase family protein [Pleomorphochaeta sp.]